MLVFEFILIIETPTAPLTTLSSQPGQYLSHHVVFKARVNLSLRYTPGKMSECIFILTLGIILLI